MRKNKNSKNGPGKTVAKSDLPTKVCVVCNRPFTWRKKWERVWDEVTTCSKSCNAKRRATNKHQSRNDGGAGEKENSENENDDNDDDSVTSQASTSSKGSSLDGSSEQQEDSAKATKKMLRKQHKEAVKAQKRERRAKREGNAPELGRKPCDLCQRGVDLLVRCTVDETRQFTMVCGKCWPSVSGGVPDGSPNYPHYTYGGLWKNRNANLKKRIGSKPSNSNKGSAPSADDLVRQIQESASISEDDNLV